MKFWDFPGMTQTLEPFRYLEPQEGHQIRSLSYSVSGDNILVCTGSATPLLYDRDGLLVATSGLYSNEFIFWEMCRFDRSFIYCEVSRLKTSFQIDLRSFTQSI